MIRMMMGCLGSIDPYTVLLLHMDGENGSTAFVDSSPYARAVTAAGGVEQSTARAKFGAASSLHDGDSDYLVVTGIAPGTGAFCIEMWVYITTSDAANYVVSYGGTNETATSGFAAKVTDAFTFYASAARITATALSLNAWHHIAIVGNGGANGSRTIKLYSDGNQAGSTYTTDYNYTGKDLWIGANEDSGGQCLFGHIDEVRISIGTERYTGSFTPPAAPFAG
ncbi:MAG: LamG domain-containing protein [Christensenella sp.]|nr:LamG domain-containing protein [Christensenella sp.]